MSLGSIADAFNATERLYGVFEAETLAGTQIHDTDLKPAIEIKSAEFSWDTPPHVEDQKKGKVLAVKEKSSIPAVVRPSKAMPFKVKEIDLSIPRGQLIAIVGPVGAGKTSLLQGLIGEMRRTSGSVKFGGSVSYCPQSAWIQVSLIC
jgi:ABC-type transport system involved in cytochrome bd biosynthesis fused ATPase/permease subunit